MEPKICRIVILINNSGYLNFVAAILSLRLVSVPEAIN